MKLLFTDLHLREDRIEDQTEVLKQIATEANSNKNIEDVFILGDVFHDRNKVSSLLLTVFESFLNSIHKEVYIISGNHDKPFNEARYSFLTVYKQKWNNKIKVIDYGSLLVENILLIPYMPERELLRELRKYYDTKVEYIFLHAGFKNAVLRDKETLKRFLSKDKLSVKLFHHYSKLKKVFCGHYHNAYDYPNSNFSYMGNAIQLSHGEDEYKGYIILDNIKHKYQHVDTIFPKFRTLDLKCNAKDYKKAIDFIKDNEGNFIRLRFKDEKERIKTIPEDLLNKNSKCRELRIDKDFYEKQDEGEEQEIIEAKNLEESFLEYAEQEEMTEDEKQYGLEKLNEH